MVWPSSTLGFNASHPLGEHPRPVRLERPSFDVRRVLSIGGMSETSSIEP